MTEQRYMKCAFCDWRTPRYITLKNGTRTPGWKRLELHVINEHEEEAKRAYTQARLATEPWEDAP